MTSLEELVTENSQFEAIIADWDETQRGVAFALKRAIEELHKEAITRLIKSVKQESMTSLRHAVKDEVVYAVLLYHELIKPPKPPLEQRIQTALDEVRPGLKSHNGDVELVAIKPPDTVEVRLMGSCSNCPASTLTLYQGVEQAIKTHCREITRVIAVTNNSSHGIKNHDITSPFSQETTSSWFKVTDIDKIPELSVLPVQIEGESLILYRQGMNITCYRNICTHLASPLDTDKVEDGVITCPSHGFQYRLDTGESLTFSDVSLQPYPLKLEENMVFVELKNS